MWVDAFLGRRRTNTTEASVPHDRRLELVRTEGVMDAPAYRLPPGNWNPESSLQIGIKPGDDLAPLVHHIICDIGRLSG